MADESAMTKAELLAKMQAGWETLNAYVKSLTEAQLTGPKDAVGWTVRDHLVHLAVWADGIDALLQKQSRRERMGLDEETWQSRDFDRMNAVIQQHFRATPLPEVLRMLEDSHRRLLARVEAMTEADLWRPFRDYQPGSTSDHPVAGSIMGNHFGHYEEHLPWMQAISNGS